VVFFVAVGVVKMSITAFNMRVTGFASQRYIYAHRLFFVILGCYTILAIFLNVFKCSPVCAGFDAITAGKLPNGFVCSGSSMLNKVLRVINITLDFCLVFIFISLIWRVQMTAFMKIKLAALFSVGTLACIGSVMVLVSEARLASDVFCKSYPQVTASRRLLT
jgi:hypothetical protein